MMRTFSVRLRTLDRSRVHQTVDPVVSRAQAPMPAPNPARRSEEGFMLIEVMISALLVGLIVIATLNGFDAANRASADERSHAQADGLAQQDEDRLRGMQVSELSGLSQTREVIYNGTHYTVKSSAKFVADSTGSESCTSGSTSADYIRTTSEVGWPALKTRPKVVETGLIAPRLGGSILVQVFDASAKGDPGMTVTATGPSPSASTETGTTDANGCVIFGSMEPGEYKVTTHQIGYVEKNGNSEPPISEQSATVLNGSTTKKEFEFAQAGEITVSFAGGPPAEGDTWLAFNPSMTNFRAFGTLETYQASVTSPKTMFPFTSPYTVYAGSCESDDPHAINPAIKDPEAPTGPGGLPAGGSASATVTVPPIKIKVMSGKSAGTPGKAIENAVVWLEDTGCKTVHMFKTNAAGALPRPGVPFGKYSLCVTGGALGGNNGATKGLAAKRKYTTSVTNDTVAGPSALATMTNGGLSAGSAVIYMEKPATGIEEKSTCP
jgi:Tfp pilus assembly protein PilV